MSKEWPTRAIPRSDAARESAASAIIDIQRWKDIDSSKLAKQLSPFFDSGWCVDAVKSALYFRPDSTAQPEVSTGGQQLEDVRFRLSAWRGNDGHPLPPPVQADEETGAPNSTQRSGTDPAKEAALRDRDWPVSVIPETLTQRSKATDKIRSSRPWDQLTRNEVLNIVAPFFGANWSVDCILHAVETHPLTHKRSPVTDDSDDSVIDKIKNRLAEWKDKQGTPKKPPKQTLTYDQWHEKLEQSGAFDIRERRKTRSRIQYESVRQAQEEDTLRKKQRFSDRVSEARERDQRWQESLDALYQMAPDAPDVEVPVAAPGSHHDRLLEGVSHLAATDKGLMNWLRTLLDMEPDKITQETAKVTRNRMRDAHTRANLALLEQMSTPTKELSMAARELTEYAMGAPDLGATYEVRAMWHVLRSAVRAHDRKSHSSPRRKDSEPQKLSEITDGLRFSQSDTERRGE